MADEKFEDTERKIAQAENVLLENGKFVTSDFEENHLVHLEEHEKGGGQDGNEDTHEISRETARD